MHGFFPSIFQIDWYSVLILFILSIPVLAPYLRRAKVPGAEFEFKDEILETKKLVQKSIKETQKKNESSANRKTISYETFNLTPIRELLGSDHTLALAALRIEIERRLRNLIPAIIGKKADEFSSISLVELIKKLGIFSSEQFSALSKIITMCNKAIHGASVSKSQAEEIISLTEQLNQSFSIGYSINLSSNPEYEKQGLLCEWEHCIELMPLSKRLTKISCPVFGHNCPGGLNKVSSCDKNISDIPRKRFVKNE